MTRYSFATCVFVVFSTVAWGQSTQTMTANIRGGGGDSGKCTIEVDVDGVAEVEVRGDRGFIRTLEGQPSNWRRFECNSVMPRNPVDFRFRGIDGRGRVQLVREPSSGSAVVRIEDTKGGREGYTFDLEWRGGSGNWSNDDRFPLGRDRGGYNDDRRGGGYNDDRRGGGFGNNSGRFDMRRSIGLCQDVVAARARREHNVRNPNFRTINVEDLRGNRDRVEGEFEGNRGQWYQYSCTVNGANGDIRNVEIRRR
jgi:hypothetical protein